MLSVRDGALGVQMADLVAYVIQRARSKRDSHPDTEAAINRLCQAVANRTATWRETWPS